MTLAAFPVDDVTHQPLPVARLCLRQREPAGAAQAEPAPVLPEFMDGLDTAEVAGKFQAEKRLAVDGKIGPDTWAAAWSAPVT